MISLFSTLPTLDTNLQFNCIVSVDQLHAFDMIYVYHHISEGTNLELVPHHQHLNEDVTYKVMFKHFHIGFVRLRRFMIGARTNQDSIHASVSSMSKEKYLPTKELDISIKSNKMKLVS